MGQSLLANQSSDRIGLQSEVKQEMSVKRSNKSRKRERRDTNENLKFQFSPDRDGNCGKFADGPNKLPVSHDSLFEGCFAWEHWGPRCDADDGTRHPPSGLFSLAGWHAYRYCDTMIDCSVAALWHTEQGQYRTSLTELHWWAQRSPERAVDGRAAGHLLVQIKSFE